MLIILDRAFFQEQTPVAVINMKRNYLSKIWLEFVLVAHIIIS